MANASVAAPKKRKSISYEKWGYLFIAPFIIVYLIFNLVPLFQTFYFSFFEKYTNSATWETVEVFVGFQQYINIFTEGRIFSYLGNTLIMWVMGFIPQIVVSLLFAYWFTSVRLRLKALGFFKTVMYMPNLIMAAAFSMMFMLLFSDIGPINGIIKQLNNGNPYQFFAHPWSTRALVALMNFLMWFGNTTILLMAAMMGVDASIVEAAEIDGCTSSQIFWKIVLPIIRPILIYVLITSLVGGLQMYDVPSILTNGKGSPNDTTTTLIMYLNTLISRSKNYGLGGAVSVFIFVICAVLSMIVYYFFTDAGVEKREKRKSFRLQKKGGK
ncbi:MAG: sugar ABC transporter permease [Oscillospiraceae bacterium]|nr:sugar ABC transporter permease [Oscillospiraceae bacterium]